MAVTMTWGGVVVNLELVKVAGVNVIKVRVTNNSGKDITLSPGIYIYLFRAGEVANPEKDWSKKSPYGGVGKLLGKITLCGSTVISKTKRCTNRIQYNYVPPLRPGEYDPVVVWNQDGKVVGVKYLGRMSQDEDTYSRQGFVTKASLARYDNKKVYIHFEAVNATRGPYSYPDVDKILSSPTGMNIGKNSLPRLDILVRRNGGEPVVRASYTIGQTVPAGWFTRTTLSANLILDGATGKAKPGHYEVGLRYWYGSRSTANRTDWLGSFDIGGGGTTPTPPTVQEATLQDVLYRFKYSVTGPTEVRVGDKATYRVIIENPTNKRATLTVKWFDDNTCAKTVTVEPNSKVEVPCTLTVSNRETGIITVNPKVYWHASYIVTGIDGKASKTPLVKRLSFKSVVVDNYRQWVIVRWPTTDIAGGDINPGDIVQVDFEFNNPTKTTLTFEEHLEAVGDTTVTRRNDFQVPAGAKKKGFDRFTVPDNLKKITLRFYIRGAGTNRTLVYDRTWEAPNLPFGIGGCKEGAEKCVGQYLYRCINGKWVLVVDESGKCGGGEEQPEPKPPMPPEPEPPKPEPPKPEPPKPEPPKPEPPEPTPPEPEPPGPTPPAPPQGGESKKPNALLLLGLAALAMIFMRGEK